MKKIVALSLCIAGILLSSCVQGPVAVNDTGDHDPKSAAAVTLANADSLLDTHRFGIIEFYSSDCPVCTSLVWVIDSLAFELADSILVGANNTAQDSLWKRYAITSVPTYLLFKDGAEVTRRSFSANKPQVYDTLAALLATILDGGTVVDTGDTVVPPDTTAPANGAIAFSTAGFDSAIVAGGAIAMIDFYSPLCATCQTIAPVVDSLAAAFGDSIVIGKVNVDAESSLRSRYSIIMVPQMLFFSQGELLFSTGFGLVTDTTFDSLATLVRAHIAGTLVADTGDTALPADSFSLSGYITLDTLTFDSTVMRPDRVAMVFFLYAGGLPCIHMDSVVAEIAPLYENKAIIAKVHAWDQMPLSARYNIYSVPRFLFFKDAQLIEQRSGIVPGDTLSAILDRLLSAPAEM